MKTYGSTSVLPLLSPSTHPVKTPVVHAPPLGQHPTAPAPRSTTQCEPTPQVTARSGSASTYPHILFSSWRGSKAGAVASGHGSTASVRCGSVVVRRGRMCAAARGASTARRRAAVGGGSRRRAFGSCICGAGEFSMLRWCKSGEGTKPRVVDVRCARFVAILRCTENRNASRYARDGKKKKRSFRS